MNLPLSKFEKVEPTAEMYMAQIKDSGLISFHPKLQALDLEFPKEQWLRKDFMLLKDYEDGQVTKDSFQYYTPTKLATYLKQKIIGGKRKKSRKSKSRRKQSRRRR
jgi:hypothetical protein